MTDQTVMLLNLLAIVVSIGASYWLQIPIWKGALAMLAAIVVPMIVDSTSPDDLGAIPEAAGLVAYFVLATALKIKFIHQVAILAAAVVSAVIYGFLFIRL